MRVRGVLMAGIAIWAVAASAYAYRARDSAIRGWNHSKAMTAERDEARKALVELSSHQEQLKRALAKSTAEHKCNVAPR